MYGAAAAAVHSPQARGAHRLILTIYIWDGVDRDPAPLTMGKVCEGGDQHYAYSVHSM